jgi:hypothetical protein
VREARVASVAHFTVYNILPRGCLLWLFTVKAVVGLEDEQPDVSTHAFCL